MLLLLLPSRALLGSLLLLGLLGLVAGTDPAELLVEVVHKPEECVELSAQGDTLHVHYTGRLNDGSVFDTSAMRDPLQVELGKKQVIPVCTIRQGLLSAKSMLIGDQEKYFHTRMGAGLARHVCWGEEEARDSASPGVRQEGRSSQHPSGRRAHVRDGACVAASQGDVGAGTGDGAALRLRGPGAGVAVPAGVLPVPQGVHPACLPQEGAQEQEEVIPTEKHRARKHAPRGEDE